MTRSLQLGSFHFNALRSLLHWSMEMSSLNHTERAVMMHERKGSLGCDLYVVKKKRKNVYRGKYIKKTARGKKWKSIWTKSIKAHCSNSFQAHADKLWVGC